ncbi:MAG TPA: hypothetical protein VNN18_03630 [Candidatus Xenobia bacterium]|nr:hypothetical protein [Candidatus Xenobia bacterium]
MNSRQVAILLAFLALGAWAPSMARAQALSAPVLALYPPQAGEVVFVDLQTARRSPHFARLKEQLLPQRFRDLERVSAALGVDFDRNVDRLSYAVLGVDGGTEQIEMMGVVEGSYDLRETQRAAARSKLGTRAYRGAQMFSLGTNERGVEFVFAFRDNATCLFGSSAQVEAMLDRAAKGGANLLDDPEMRALINEVNRSAPIWLVLNGQFTKLGVLQFLGEGASLPGAETLAERVRNAAVRITLERSLDSTVTARCATSADAAWFSTLLEAAVYFQRQRVNASNPTLARVLNDARVGRDDDRVSFVVSIPESDLATLLETRTFTLHF